MESPQGVRGLGPCFWRVRLSFAALPRLDELLTRRPRQRIGIVHVVGNKFTMLKPQLVTTKRIRLDAHAADRPTMQPRVVNLVLTSTVNTTLNLQQLVTDLKFEYNPQRFAAATAHFSVPHITWSVA